MPASVRASPARRPRPGGTGRCCRRSAPRPAAAAGAQTGRASQSRRGGQPLRGRPVQCGAGDHDVRAGQLVVAVDHDQVETARIHAAGAAPAPRAGCLDAAQRRRRRAMPPQPMTRPGSGARSESATAASGLGHSRAATHFQGGRGTSVRSSCGTPDGFRQPDRLRMQAGQRFTENPRRGGFRHGGAFRRAAGKGQCGGGVNRPIAWTITPP